MQCVGGALRQFLDLIIIFQLKASVPIFAQVGSGEPTMISANGARLAGGRGGGRGDQGQGWWGRGGVQVGGLACCPLVEFQSNFQSRE